ncbi:MAG: hypothetical protein V3U54_13310 [Thermodesulfobacteriota bacterium]
MTDDAPALKSGAGYRTRGREFFPFIQFFGKFLDYSKVGKISTLFKS